MELPDVPTSEELRFQTRLRTRWVDEDNQCVLNNAVYLTLMEEARLAYFTELDLMDAQRFPFVLAAANLRFVTPGKGGSEVLIEMSTTHLGSSSFAQAYRVRDGESDEIWCEAVHRMVAWDNQKRCKRAMDPEFRTRIAKFEKLS